MIEIALFPPDIAPNAATTIRMAACLGLKVTIIEPAGFAWTILPKRADWTIWTALWCTGPRPGKPSASPGPTGPAVDQAALPYSRFEFTTTDIILMGQESAGVPPSPWAAEARLLSP